MFWKTREHSELHISSIRPIQESSKYNLPRPFTKTLFWVTVFTPCFCLLHIANAQIPAGTVVAWGNNLSGQTNVPVGLTNAVGIAAGWYHSLALKSDGTVVGWGTNANGQINVPI